MTNKEKELYWEMVQSIKLLGGRSDILIALNILNSDLPEEDAVDETLRLVKFWNQHAQKINKDRDSGFYINAEINDNPCE
jgi:hypothetical protein